MNAGIYTVTITAANGCKAIETFNVLPQTPLGQALCLITVDSTIGRNRVVWEKPVTTDIAHYKIYREGTQAGIYTLLATVPYDSLSAWTDSSASPLTRSWRYKITAVDTCGNESTLSDFHKTMHLVVSNFGGFNYLLWDAYEGFAYLTCYIYRWHISTGWALFDSIPSNLHSYTDTAPPAGTVKYFVEVTPSDVCTASRAIDYNSSRSNIKNKFVPPASNLNITVSANDATQDSCNGSATVTATGGISPYSYQWSDSASQTTATATGLCVGNYTVTATDSEGDTAVATITIGVTPAIWNLEFGTWDLELHIYPNPSDGTFTLTIEMPNETTAEIRIYTLTGDLVYLRNVRELTREHRTIISVPGFAAGNYILEVEGRRGVVQRKIGIR